MVGVPGTAASGTESNIFGSGVTGSEALTQSVATEDAAFTGLRGRQGSGGSTNTVQFRDNGANGQNVISVSGTGSGEDTTHTDSLTAGDLFNLAFTDNGTDPSWTWVAANVEFASGHGCFHGAANFGNGAICDVASSVRYLPINGNLLADGVTPAAGVQFHNRAYSGIEAIQVNVQANARTNDSVFSVNVNGSDTGTTITYAAGETGIKTATGLGISIAAGDLVCISLTLLSGTQDLNVRSVGVTMKSAAGKSDLVAQVQSSVSRSASSTATLYIPGGHLTASASARIKVGFAARCSNLRMYAASNSYTGSATLKLLVNNVAQITLNISAGATGWLENTSDTFDISPTDDVCFEIDEGSSGSLGISQLAITFAPITSAQPPRTMAINRMRRAA